VAVEERADVRVSEGGCLGLALEAGAAIIIGGDARGENLDGDRAIEADVAGLVHSAHAAGPERGLDLIRPEASAGRERHNEAGAL